MRAGGTVSLQEVPYTSGHEVGTTEVSRYMENAKKQKIAKNAGKVQFLANKDVIREMLSQGHNYRNIYECLVKEYHVTMSYHTFCFWMRNTTKQNPEKIFEKNPTVLPKILAGTKPQDKFMRPEHVDTKDLF